MTAEAILLLTALLIGHFLGDFTPLSTPRMLAAKRNGGPILPIAAHSAVHSVLTGIAVLVVARPAPGLVAIAAGIQFTTHLALDGARARVGIRRPALNDPSGDVFWTALGLDQLSHALVLLGIAALVL